MRMIKRLTVVIAAMAAACLAGCGGAKGDFDVAALGNDLATKITYQDSLAQMDLDSAGMFLNLSGLDVVKASVYEGSGADDVPFLFGIAHSHKLIKETVDCVHINQVRIHLVAEYFDDLLGLAFSKEAVIDMHADQLLADRLDQQRRNDGRIHTA